MTENRVFLLGLFAFAALTVAIALLVAPDWMNWGGWRWVSMPWAIWVGIWFGWSIKATNERSRWFRAMLELRRPVTEEEWARACTHAFARADQTSKNQHGMTAAEILLVRRLIDVENAQRR